MCGKHPGQTKKKELFKVTFRNTFYLSEGIGMLIFRIGSDHRVVYDGVIQIYVDYSLPFFITLNSDHLMSNAIIMKHLPYLTPFIIRRLYQPRMVAI